MNKGIRITSLAIILLCFLLQARGYGADKADIPILPPMAKPLEVTAYTGTSTEIPLTIGGRIVEPTTVLIRKPPRLGSLGELERTSRETATVLYTPGPGAGPGTDSFSFAAKSVDSPVSASATVRIRLVEIPPRMEFPRELDFGTVFLGDTVEKDVAIRNTGGGIAFWQIKPSPPWRVSSPGSYQVAGGAESVLRFVFAPAEERDFRDRIQMTPDPESVLAVSGAGVAPVSWNKDGLVFLPKQRETGSAEIQVANQTPEERKMTFEWPEFLKAPKEILIPPNGTAALQVEVVGDPQINYQGGAPVRSGNFQSRIPIRIFPAAAKLAVNPDRVLKLIGNSNGGTQKGRFVVRNTGGSDAPVEILAPPEVLVTPDPRNLILSAGQEQAFEVQLESRKQDRWNVRIQSPACDPVELSLETPVSKQSGPSLPVENFLSIPKKPAVSSGMPGSVPGRVPPVKKPTILSSEPHEIVLTWKLPSPEASGFRIERRSIAPGTDGGVAVTWIPWQGAQLGFREGMAVARLERLPANTLWTIHIVPLDEKGKPGEPSPAFQISTQPMSQLRIPWWAWILCLAALAAGLVRLWRKYQASLHAVEDERIARLERK